MTEFIFKIKIFSILLLLSFTNVRAEEINCKRTSSDTTGFTNYSAMESWFPKNQF